MKLKKEKENHISQNLTAFDVINSLRGNLKEVPYSHLKFLEDNKDAAEKEILKEMETYMSDPDKYAMKNLFLSVYMPFILCQWERKGSSRDIIDLVACSEKSVDIRIGEVITEEYPVIIYRCFDGDLNYLKSKIEKEDVGEFPKLAYLRALSMYYVKDLKDIEGLKVYLEELLKKRPTLATAISDIVLMHPIDKLLPLGLKAVKSWYYDPFVNGNIAEYRSHFENCYMGETLKYKVPFNAIKSIGDWFELSDD